MLRNNQMSKDVDASKKTPDELTGSDDSVENIFQGRWSSKQRALIFYLANPQGKTQEEFRKEIGVSRETISVWKKIPGFMEDVHRIAEKYFLEWDLAVDRATLRDALRDITADKALANAIIKARELYYRRRGLLVDKNSHSLTDGGVIEVIVKPPQGVNGGNSS